MRVIEINVSQESPKEGERAGLLKESIGPIEAVPKIIFYNEGNAKYFPIDKRNYLNGYEAKEIMDFAKVQERRYKPIEDDSSLTFA